MTRINSEEVKRTVSFEMKQYQKQKIRESESLHNKTKEENESIESRNENIGKRLSQIRATKHLQKLIRISETHEIITIQQWLDGLLVSGGELSVKEVNKIKPLSRVVYNRATNEQQYAHEQRIKDSGSKLEYSIGNRTINKTEYDYCISKTNKD